MEEHTWLIDELDFLSVECGIEGSGYAFTKRWTEFIEMGARMFWPPAVQASRLGLIRMLTIQGRIRKTEYPDAPRNNVSIWIGNSAWVNTARKDHIQFTDSYKIGQRTVSIVSEIKANKP